MGENETIRQSDGLSEILIVDDENAFRSAMKKQLEVRGYRVWDADNGEDAIKIIRHDNPEVVILDQKMPKMDGIQTLREIKKLRPEVQVIMLTGHGSTESARVTGKYDVFSYLQKPCGLDELVDKIEAARKERVYAMARHEIPHVEKDSVWKWLLGAHNRRPGLIMLGFLAFAVITFMPIPNRLHAWLSAQKTETLGEPLMGYADYRKMKAGETIPEYYSEKAGWTKKVHLPDGTEKKVALTLEQAGFRAKVMTGILAMSVVFWASGAIPVGMTALVVCALMYFFGILPPDKLAQAFAKDSVFFVFGVLAIGNAIGKTGLDRRIGSLLLGTSTSPARLLFIFPPLLAVTASFLSEHALVAFLAPIFMLGYMSIIRAAGLQKDRNLAVMMLLMLTFAGNVGGPGSPAAGGRNAVMVSILSDYGMAPTFGQWVKLGLPLVPVLALSIALYFYLVFRNKIQVKDFNLAIEIARESEKIGKMTRQEYFTAGVLVLLVILWCAFSNRFGMGGPVILAIVLLNILGVIRWRDVASIHWDVVALYAAATATGAGLAITGGAVWLADTFVSMLPEYMKSGTGLAMSASIISGVITNFMSDGATVAAVGPITVPMATISGVSPVVVGLATAFASSYAFMFIVGTPNNAIVYSFAKDPETGEQLVTSMDFLKHGTVILVICLVVTWAWAFFGYWQWMGVFK
ncbi:MAG: response regulator [Candidatus Abyssobacteria bacterium SURF_17]|uniref:Response regulator n=1 Tax=Candidatus Abyssobacteria bacterium SURF_17 TaxID=2093361 RepID=A0A419F8B8_9BACT|nr:MAG: response regulator [Candidatus Abyssubacteria bacterium SURF_17]